MGKKVAFIYHPKKQIDEEKARLAQRKVIQYLVEIALEKAADPR